MLYLIFLPDDYSACNGFRDSVRPFLQGVTTVFIRHSAFQMIILDSSETTGIITLLLAQ